MIHGLQYNDSSYQFLSTVKVTQDTGGVGGSSLNTDLSFPLIFFNNH